MESLGGEDSATSFIPNQHHQHQIDYGTNGEEAGPEIPSGTYALLNNTIVDGGDRFGVNCVKFDNQQELLWVANAGGHLTSYYGANLEKYTSFQVCPSTAKHPEIRDLEPISNGILSLGKAYIKCNKRTGLPLFNYTCGYISDMQCMMRIPGSDAVYLLGGMQESLVLFDIQKMQHISVANTPDQNSVALRSSDKFMFSGDSRGNIIARDPKSFEKIQVLEAHNGALSDFAVFGNKLVTCGFSYTRGGMHLSCDRHLMIYDVRMLRCLPPLQLPFDPAFVRFLPTYSDSRLLLTSQSGEFVTMEMGEMIGYPIQLETGGSIFSVDISNSKQCIAFGDDVGVIHVFSDTNQPLFNAHSQPTDFPDPVQNLPAMGFDDTKTSFGMIPAPFSKDGTYLSDWPHHLIQPIHRQPKPLDANIVSGCRMNGFVGYGPKDPGVLRNQVNLVYDNVLTSPFSSTLNPPSSPPKGIDTKVAKYYRRLQLKKSKLQNEDFNYRNYNQTIFSGIEHSSPNAYSCTMLLALYHFDPIKNKIMNHLCQRQFCLASIPEASALGLLISDKEESNSEQQNHLQVKIHNFTRFLLQHLHTDLSEQPEKISRVHKTESRFASKEESPKRHMSSPPDQKEGFGKVTEDETGGDEGKDNVGGWDKNEVEKLFSSRIRFINKCTVCGEQYVRNDTPLVTSLSYHLSSFLVVDASGPVDFTDVLSKSLFGETRGSLFCEKCNEFTLTSQSRKLVKPPPSLILTIPYSTQRDQNFLLSQQKWWPSARSNPISPGVVKTKACRYGAHCNRPDCRYYHPKPTSASSSTPTPNEKDEDGLFPSTWIPSAFTLDMNKKTASGKPTISSPPNVKDVDKDESVYELYGMIYLIKETSAEHLISVLKTNKNPQQDVEDEKKPRLKIKPWTVFNEMVVCNVSEEEALEWNLEWKLPAILIYNQRSFNDQSQEQFENPITDRVFWQDSENLATRRRLSNITFVPLTPEEVPKSGHIVGIDAEFVTINQEESELRSDGTKSTIKPQQMSLARVSCIRENGVPFIDDYISNSEEVADYLTKFSGIKPGDLDKCITTKHLTTLKSTYIKLRYLVDHGVIFVGHGLMNDFRVINIVVPPDQIIDTVRLFHKPNHRMVSLRFLAWHFLDIKIQAETHDSIEDARTALSLYKKYEELKEEGESVLSDAIQNLYTKGAELEWKIPQ